MTTMADLVAFAFFFIQWDMLEWLSGIDYVTFALKNYMLLCIV